MPPHGSEGTPSPPRTPQPVVSKAECHRLVAEHVSDVICLHLPDGTFQFVSPSVRDFLGYEPEDLVGQSPYPLLHPDDARDVVRPNHEALLRKKKQMFRCRFRHRNGGYRWVEVTNDFITDEDGNISLLLTASRDLSRRKQLEDRVRLFETIVEKASDAMLVTDAEERIVYVNPTFEQRTGYTFEEVKGRVPGDFLQGPETDPDTVKEMKRTIEKRSSGTFEILNYTKSGEPFYARIRIQPIHGRKGAHEGFFALQQDVSEERAAREQLNTLNQGLKDANARLQRLNQELETFAYIASHDLKEPLRNIVGLLDLLGESHREQLDAEGHELVGLSITAAERLTSMIGALLEFARTGNPSEPPGPVRIAELVQAVRDDLDRLIREKEASVTFTGQDVMVFGYKTALYRLMQNLVSNSLKHFSPPGRPEVDIRLAQTPDEWVLTVEDNGPGIPEASREAVFKLFNRVSRSGDSNGMGLALCRRIAELHNGCITLEYKARWRHLRDPYFEGPFHGVQGSLR